MERCTRRLLWFFVVLFLLLSAQLTYLQVYAAPRLNADHSNTRHIERQDALEAALAESIRDLRQGFGEYRQEHETIVEELQRHAELLERVDTNARAVTNGGLTAALEKALPAVLGALGVREQARCNMWQAIVVGALAQRRGSSEHG